jgi:membrane protein DedA with SNARE-associated domain
MVALAATRYAYAAAALAIGVESLGLPFPGETALITAAIYAGASRELNIFLVVAAAAAGAFLGAAIGFWIGRDVGFRFLLRHGSRFGMTPPRIKLGQYLFLRHGGKVVFFGRFVALLRSFMALLAGANRMPWLRFMAFNALGAIVWASFYGFTAFYLGKAVHHLVWPLALALGGAAMVFIVFGVRFLRRNEERLEAEAERVLPGAITAIRE